MSAGRSAALLAIVAASVLSSLDLFVVNIAFSSIRDSFPGATNQSLSWVLSAYSILFAAFLVPSGRLADRYGRKRVFQLGLLVFTVASAGCALAPGVASLVAARALKGVGAALMIPTSLGLLLSLYPAAKHKQMVSVWAASGSVAAALGPVVGGALVPWSWRLIFLINLPVALPALALSTRLVARSTSPARVGLVRHTESAECSGTTQPCQDFGRAKRDETPRAGSRMPDVVGSLFLAAGVGCLVGAISMSTEPDVPRSVIVATLAATFVLLFVFVRRCLRVASPALDLRVFRVPAFSIAVIGMACFYMGFAMTLLAGTLFLTQVWRWDTDAAGLAFAIGPLTGMTAALVGGRAAIAPRTLTILGGLLMLAAGLFWLAVLGGEARYATHFLPGLILTGASAGVAQTGFLAGGASALSASEYATGTGILNTARQIGAAVGVALLVAVMGSGIEARAYQPAWLVIAGFGLLTMVSAVFLGRTTSAAPAEAPLPVE